MKSLKNMKNYLLIFSIIAAGLFVRLYNFSERITFGPEQAISLSTSAQMITEKVSLLGIENVQRFTSTGLQIYSGVLFSYAIIPALILSKYDPLLITLMFLFLNVFTGLVLYFIAN